MPNLNTQFLGLDLKNPLIVGSSELSNSAEHIIDLAKAGAGAVIVKSLFEEQILMDLDAERTNNMYGAYDHIENYVGYYLKKHSIDQYLQSIAQAKKEVDIPILGSINCVSASEWIDYAKKIQDAGADALEVNVFIMPANVEMEGAEIEQTYMTIAEKVSTAIDIPVLLKLSPYFSGTANFLVKLSQNQIKGLTLFNRFYNPAIDIEEEKLGHQPILSRPEDFGNTLRWVGILSERVACDLSASTGIHSHKEVISALLAGATTTQMVSHLYKNGHQEIQKVLNGLSQWMERKGYQELADFRGKLSQANQKNPMMFERAQFMRYFADAGR